MDNLCQSISSLVLQVQGTLVEKYFSDDEEQRPKLANVTDRQGPGIMSLTKPAYRYRNSTSPTSRVADFPRTSSASSEKAGVKSREINVADFPRTSSASSEEPGVKSRETSPTILKPRASSASSSSEESVEPQKSGRKKHDKGGAGASKTAHDLDEEFQEKEFQASVEARCTNENFEDDLRLTEKQQRQGPGIMGLTKPAYRSRNSTSPTSRARTSSASSEEAGVKSRETSPTRLKPRASSASSSSEESVEPQRSSRKKYDKAAGHQEVVGSPKAQPNLAAKHVQTFVQEVSWRDNSFYVHGDSPKNQMHQNLDKWTRNKYGKSVDHGNYF